MIEGSGLVGKRGGARKGGVSTRVCMYDLSAHRLFPCSLLVYIGKMDGLWSVNIGRTVSTLAMLYACRILIGFGLWRRKGFIMSISHTLRTCLYEVGMGVIGYSEAIHKAK